MFVATMEKNKHPLQALRQMIKEKIITTNAILKIIENLLLFFLVLY